MPLSSFMNSITDSLVTSVLTPAEATKAPGSIEVSKLERAP
jgi:hypothetical protein